MTFEITEERDEDELLEAHRRLNVVAGLLRQKFPPIDAAGILIAAGAGILEEQAGSRLVAEYLRTLADELESTDTTELTTH